MNNISKTLLAGAAIGALATAPAMAGAPHFSVTALHAGNVVNKSKIHQPGRQALTYTFSVFTYVSSSDLNVGVKLGATYYKWNSYSSLCTTPKMKLKGQKTSTYGKIAHNTETYSFGCPSGPTVFHGDEYTLTSSSGFGQIDTFQSDLKGKFQNSRAKYKGNLFIDVSVEIG